MLLNPSHNPLFKPFSDPFLTSKSFTTFKIFIQLCLIISMLELVSENMRDRLCMLTVTIETRKEGRFYLGSLPH